MGYKGGRRRVLWFYLNLYSHSHKSYKLEIIIQNDLFAKDKQRVQYTHRMGRKSIYQGDKKSFWKRIV